MSAPQIDAADDIYNEEFNRYLKLAKTLILQLRSQSDKRICAKWIAKLCQLKSADPTVKKNRNQFFRYMLTVIYRCIDEKPAHGFPQYDDRFADSFKASGKSFLSRWSGDKRTYVAVKPMPGKGALVYMAVSNDLSLGWEYQTQ